MKSQIIILLGLVLLADCFSIRSYLADSCNNFDNENSCRGNQTENDASWANRAFQTPPRGHELWRENYQDYNILVGYARLSYSGSGANITVVTRVNPSYNNLKLKYFFLDLDISLEIVHQIPIHSLFPIAINLYLR